MQGWQRPEQPGAQQRKSKPMAAKERYRWLEGSQCACEVQQGCPATWVVNMADRAGAIQARFADARRVSISNWTRPPPRPSGRPTIACDTGTTTRHGQRPAGPSPAAGARRLAQAPARRGLRLCRNASTRHGGAWVCPTPHWTRMGAALGPCSAMLDVRRLCTPMRPAAMLLAPWPVLGHPLLRQCLGRASSTISGCCPAAAPGTHWRTTPLPPPLCGGRSEGTEKLRGRRGHTHSSLHASPGRRAHRKQCVGPSRFGCTSRRQSRQNT